MSKKICVFPGSFDPPTKGHIDIIKRAAAIFDEVHVGLLDNTGKSYMFDKETRKKMLETALTGENDIFIDSFDGLLVDFVKEVGATAVVRGVRNEIDFTYENQMYKINAALGKVDTVFFPAASETECVSSTFIRELIRFKADLTAFVPEEIIDMIY